MCLFKLLHTDLRAADCKNISQISFVLRILITKHKLLKWRFFFPKVEIITNLWYLVGKKLWLINSTEASWNTNFIFINK